MPVRNYTRTERQEAEILIGKIDHLLVRLKGVVRYDNPIVLNKPAMLVRIRYTLRSIKSIERRVLYVSEANVQKAGKKRH